jgi:hypothetical protein
LQLLGNIIARGREDHMAPTCTTSFADADLREISKHIPPHPETWPHVLKHHPISTMVKQEVPVIFVQKIDAQEPYCSITQPSCLSGAASILFSCKLYTPNSRYQCQNWSECYKVQANLIGKHGKKLKMNLSLTPSRKAAVWQVHSDTVLSLLELSCV